MEKVILYTQPSCGLCKEVKSFLKHHGVEVEEKNIREDKEAFNELIEANFSSTPVTLINGKLIPGFDINVFEEELGLV